METTQSRRKVRETRQMMRRALLDALKADRNGQVFRACSFCGHYQALKERLLSLENPFVD